MKEKYNYLLQPIARFIKDETTAGMLLFLSALAALILANSPWSEAYHHLWEYKFSIGFADHQISKSLHHWINDGLMAIFFFVIGLELKREIVGGELSNIRSAMFPIMAAIGGIVVPVAIYLSINMGADSAQGWGVPMATDIAFALGVLYFLGDRVPVAVKVFLTALAIVDDLAAVLVIAFVYTSQISLLSLGIGIAFLAFMIGSNVLGIRSSVFYGILGIGGLWLAFLLSGVHATIAGVLAAFTIPATTAIDEKGFTEKLRFLTDKFINAESRQNKLVSSAQLGVIGDIKKCAKAAETPLQRLEHSMHPLVAFVILPVFAFANAGITLSGDLSEQLFSPVAIGILLGLLLGKSIGISAACKLAVYFNLAALPEGMKWRHLYGAALLASIGFTMSLFITELAFFDRQFILQAKLGILVASLIGGATGYSILRYAK